MVVVGWLRFWLVAILGAGVWLGVAVAGGGRGGRVGLGFGRLAFRGPGVGRGGPVGG